MTTLSDLLLHGRSVPDHRPWPRTVIDDAIWELLAQHLIDGRLTLMGLWGDRPPDAAPMVHFALLDEGSGDIGIASLECPEGRFPSLGCLHPPAILLERAVRDLFGLEPSGLADPRPWLDHGRWSVKHPLGPCAESRDAVPYAFLPAEGNSLHQVAVGPVHAGTIEPGHFRFTVNGETVVRLEVRLGYAHKGIEGLMAGADIARCARLAGHTSGDSTVAYALAFARAVEAALGVDVPPRAVWLRALMAELERLANHLGDIGAVCNDASFALMHAQCGILRERTLRLAAACFGHRLMMDRVVPGGVASDIDAAGIDAVREYVGDIRRTLPALVSLYDNTASLQDRTVGAGILRADLARTFGCGGYVGRASGRGFDARRTLRYAPYDQLRFDVPVLQEGDVNARVWIRVREVEQSLALAEQILAQLPSGTLCAEIAPRPDQRAEGLAVVEGFRGDILIWARIKGTTVERCHLRDPSWFQWPLIEAAIEGNIVADFPLCNKSFNCSYSGHDL